MKMKEVKDMSNEELRIWLGELRLKRKTGYDRKPRSEHKRRDVPDSLKNVNDDLAALVLAELEKRKGDEE